MSDVRRVLRRLLDKGWLDEGAVRDAVLEVGAPDVLDGVRPGHHSALARRVVLARRGHGYVLLLPSTWFTLDLAG